MNALKHRMIAGHDDKQGKGQARMPKVLRAILAPPLLSAPMLLGGCGEQCKLPSRCDAAEYDITLREGETTDTLTQGVPVHIKVISIDVGARIDGDKCKGYDGKATMQVSVETDPPSVEEYEISSSTCASWGSQCVAFNDVEITSSARMQGDASHYSDDAAPAQAATGGDAGEAVGACIIYNKRVSFTLGLGR
jgi:hypothetical protein